METQTLGFPAGTRIPPRVTAHRFARATVRPLSGFPTAHTVKECGHARHLGTCPACQRAALRRAALQLAEATLARHTWQAQTG
jgi:hypothetical protein